MLKRGVCSVETENRHIFLTEKEDDYAHKDNGGFNRGKDEYGADEYPVSGF